MAPLITLFNLYLKFVYLLVLLVALEQFIRIFKKSLITIINLRLMDPAMKTLNSFFAALLLMGLWSCGPTDSEKQENPDVGSEKWAEVNAPPYIVVKMDEDSIAMSTGHVDSPESEDESADVNRMRFTNAEIQVATSDVEDESAESYYYGGTGKSCYTYTRYQQCRPEYHSRQSRVEYTYHRTVRDYRSSAYYVEYRREKLYYWQGGDSGYSATYYYTGSQGGQQNYQAPKDYSYLMPYVKDMGIFYKPRYDRQTAELGRFGRKLFEERRFSQNGKVACATCHDESRSFTDGRSLGRGIGTVNRHTPTIINAAGLTSLFWDGRASTLEEQAKGPILADLEHGSSANQVARVIAQHHRAEYESHFGRMGPAEEVFDNFARAIAAYERGLVSDDSPFDRFARKFAKNNAPQKSYVKGFGEAELLGLELFVGKGNCQSCHSGKYFTDQGFHNIGLSQSAPEPDLGRYAHLAESSRRAPPEMQGAFKTPTLRNLTETAPYMHDGSINNLYDVIRHYTSGDKRPAVGAVSSKLKPIRLSHSEIRYIERFLRSLYSPVKDLSRDQ